MTKNHVLKALLPPTRKSRLCSLVFLLLAITLVFLSLTTSVQGRGTGKEYAKEASLQSAQKTTGSSNAAPAGSTGTYPYNWGVYIAATQNEEDTFPNMSLINSVEQESGAHMNYIMWYIKWGDAQTGAFNAQAINDVLHHGSIPQISWQSDEPYNYSDSNYSDSAIAGGSQDSYLHSWTAGLKSIHGMVQIRLDYEMNGNWSAWAPGNNGNTPDSFIAMWRHVHDLFAADGVTNVQWLWTPNADFPGAFSMTSLYPGDAYVDWVGTDGYNYIPFNPDHVWDSPAQVFDQSLAELRSITSKPLMISEVGCAEVGGNKAAWIKDFFAYVNARPFIHNFVWFDISKETDWRIDSSGASVSAFKTGIQGGSTRRDVFCYTSPPRNISVSPSVLLGRPEFFGSRVAFC